MVINKRQED